MRKYNAETRGKLLRVQDKIGFAPPTQIIPNIIPPQVDKRTKKSRQVLKTFEIRPSFETRKYNIETETVDGYMKTLNMIHKRFADGKRITDTVQSKIRSILTSSHTVASAPEIEIEMPYISPENVDEFIKTMRAKHPNNSTYKTYITPFTSLTSHIASLRDSYQKLTRVAKEANEAVEENRKKNEIAEEDKGKVIDLSDRSVLLKNMTLLKNLRDRIIYGLYTLMPARRLETRELVITYKTDVKKLMNNNYVIMSNPMKVVWNSYKTYKEYGQQVYTVPKELADVFELYVQTYNLHLRVVEAVGKVNSTA